MKTLIITALFTLVILSSPNANAVTLNATKIGGIYTTNPAGAIFANAATAFRSLTPMGAAVTVGRVFAYMTLADAINSMRIQAGSNSALPAPAGWSDANTPPTTTSKINGYRCNSCNVQGYKLTANEICSHDIFNDQKNIYPTASYSTVSGSTCSIFNASNQLLSAHTLVYGNGCLVGYSDPGNGTCLISNSSKVTWPADNIPTYSASSTIFAPHTRDPDNQGYSNAGSYTRTGTDIYNNPAKETVTPNASGGFDYVRDTQGINQSTGEPVVQRDRFSTDSEGAITFSSSTTYNNSTTTNVNTSNPVGDTQQIDTSLLAKDATLQEIKTALNVETVPDVSGADGGIIDLGNTAVSEISGSNTNLSNLPTQNVIPIHFWDYSLGTCYPMTFNAGKFGTFSLESFCWIYDTYIRNILIFIIWTIGFVHAYYFWQDTVRRMF